ncbi:Protein CBG16793 [Caenorhabditis briggsae]|uniref:Protein CBG16793 n=1 Tax=Caenorhabditis briggsae TaxID=6238 RepID=A8XPT7_CAEBR|nr:Protein CBG16793 [Caenorhabditis briggsae]CAP34663.1 Protein CBG16793 [Caenorhabditis briggsae]
MLRLDALCTKKITNFYLNGNMKHALAKEYGADKLVEMSRVLEMSQSEISQDVLKQSNGNFTKEMAESVIGGRHFTGRMGKRFAKQLKGAFEAKNNATSEEDFGTFGGLRFDKVTIDNENFNKHFCDVIFAQELASLVISNMDSPFFNMKEVQSDDGSKESQVKLIPILRKLISTESEQSLNTLSIKMPRTTRFERDFVKRMLNVLTNLSSLTLSNIRVNDTDFNVDSSLLKNITELDLSFSKIPTFEFLKSFEKLEILDVSGAELKESDVEAICKMKTLQTLHIDGAKSSEGPSSNNLETYIKSDNPLSELSVLTIENCKIDKAGLQAILQTHPHLREINLISTSLSRTQMPTMGGTRILSISTIEQTAVSLTYVISSPGSSRRDEILSTLLEEMKQIAYREEYDGTDGRESLSEVEHQLLLDGVISFIKMVVVEKDQENDDLMDAMKILNKLTIIVPIEMWSLLNQALLRDVMLSLLKRYPLKLRPGSNLLSKITHYALANLGRLLVHNEGPENLVPIVGIAVETLKAKIELGNNNFVRCFNILNSYFEKMSHNDKLKIIRECSLDELILKFLKKGSKYALNFFLGRIAKFIGKLAFFDRDVPNLDMDHRIEMLHFLIEEAKWRYDESLHRCIVQCLANIFKSTRRFEFFEKFWDPSRSSIQHILSLLHADVRFLQRAVIELMVILKTAWQGHNVTNNRWDTLFNNVQNQTSTISGALNYRRKPKDSMYAELEFLTARRHANEIQEFARFFLEKSGQNKVTGEPERKRRRVR